MEAAESDEARQGRVAKLEEGGAGAGAAATEPEPEPAAVSSATLQDLSGSESESESESDSEPEAEAPEPGAVGGKKQNPRFKNDAEREAHEAAVAQAALQDKATLRRLEEVRARREKARLERDAADKAAAEQQARDAAKIAAQETKKASGERPKLDMPGPKEIKSTLLTLQNVASPAFLKKHGLQGAGGNKLAKIKGAAFKKIFEDFQQNAEVEELHKYQEEC